MQQERRHGGDESDRPEQVWLLAFAGERPVVFRANDLVSQAAAARAGMGVAALPCFLARDDPGLVEVPADLSPMQRDIHLVVHSDLRRMPAVRVVLDFVADQVAPGRSVGGPLAPEHPGQHLEIHRAGHGDVAVVARM